MDIRDLRVQAGLTQTEVANIIGCTQVSVLKWESGKNKPTIDKICKLAELYKVSESVIISAVTSYGSEK